MLPVPTRLALRRRVVPVLLLSTCTAAFGGLVVLAPATSDAEPRAVRFASSQPAPELAAVEQGRERVVARASRSRRIAEAEAAAQAAAQAAAAQAAAEAAAAAAAAQAAAEAEARAAADAQAKAEAEVRAKAEARAEADAAAATAANAAAQKAAVEKAAADKAAAAKAAAEGAAAAKAAEPARGEAQDDTRDSARQASTQPAAAPAAPSSRGTACPVPNAQFTDTYGAARSGGRAHQGTDLLAPLGSPVYAVVSGRIRTASSSLGGISLYLEGDNGETYFYAHNSANVASTGQRVQAGDLVAKVGSTGNAGGTNHVHFERQLGGRSVNPYGFLREIC